MSNPWALGWPRPDATTQLPVIDIRAFQRREQWGRRVINTDLVWSSGHWILGRRLALAGFGLILRKH